MGFKGERRENNFLPGTGETAPYITSKEGKKKKKKGKQWKRKGKKTSFYFL